MTVPLTCPDVAEILGVTRQCVATWASEGVLPGQKTSGGMWLFDLAVVAAFVPPSRRPRRTGCAVDGCELLHHSLGYCKPHYQRVSRTNDAKPDVPIGHAPTGRGAAIDLIDTGEL